MIRKFKPAIKNRKMVQYTYQRDYAGNYICHYFETVFALDGTSKKREFVKTLHISGLKNKTYNGSQMIINLKELDFLFRKIISTAKKRKIRYLSFDTWIFFEHHKLLDYFLKKYNLSLFHYPFEEINKLEQLFKDKKIVGYDYETKTLKLLTKENKIETQTFGTKKLPLFVLEIKN